MAQNPATMAITKEELKKKVMWIKETWLDEGFEKDVDKILDSGFVDFEKSENNFAPAYPIVAALLEQCADRCIYGFSYEEDICKANRLKNNYKKV